MTDEVDATLGTLPAGVSSCMYQREERRVGREGGIEGGRERERESGREKSVRAGSEGARGRERAPRERTHQPCSTFVASPHKGYKRTRRAQSSRRWLCIVR